MYTSPRYSSTWQAHELHSLQVRCLRGDDVVTYGCSDDTRYWPGNRLLCHLPCVSPADSRSLDILDTHSPLDRISHYQLLVLSRSWRAFLQKIQDKINIMCRTRLKRLNGSIKINTAHHSSTRELFSVETDIIPSLITE